MDSNCYKCKYYDEFPLYDWEDALPICQCDREEYKPIYCLEKENEDANTTGNTEDI